MSWFIRLVSGLSILVIVVVWGVLSILQDKLLDVPQSIMVIAFVLFAGEKGIDFIINKRGKNVKDNNISKSKDTNS